MTKTQLFRRVAIVGGLTILAIMLAAVTADVLQGGNTRFGQGRLRGAYSDVGMLAFLVLLAPAAVWAAIRNWR